MLMARLLMIRVHNKDNDCVTPGLAFQMKIALFSFQSRHPPAWEDQHFEPRGEGNFLPEMNVDAHKVPLQLMGSCLVRHSAQSMSRRKMAKFLNQVQQALLCPFLCFLCWLQCCGVCLMRVPWRWQVSSGCFDPHGPSIIPENNPM